MEKIKFYEIMVELDIWGYLYEPECNPAELQHTEMEESEAAAVKRRAQVAEKGQLH